MFTAILWDYDGTLANTPVKNLAVTKAVLGRLDPALLDPLPEALTSLAAYQAANYRWRNWRELYRHALGVPVDRLDEAGALWGPCQLADRTLPPLFDGLTEVLPRLAALAPRTTAETSAPPWPPTGRRGGLPPWWATRTWTSPIRSRIPPPSWPAWTIWGSGRGASPTSGTTPGTSPSAAMPRRRSGLRAGRRR